MMVTDHDHHTQYSFYKTPFSTSDVPVGLEGGKPVLELHVTIDVVRDDLTAEFTS
jgi:hypothetical protein